LGLRAPTLGESAALAAVRLAGRLKPPGEGWSWHEVAWLVDRLFREQCAISPAAKYSLDAEFVRDLGIS
jgi:hypothetical protein